MRVNDRFVLDYVKEVGAATAKNVSEAFEMPITSANTILSRLEDCGYVRHIEIGKAFLYEATPRGKRMSRSKGYFFDGVQDNPASYIRQES